MPPPPPVDGGWLCVKVRLYNFAERGGVCDHIHRENMLGFTACPGFVRMTHVCHIAGGLDHGTGGVDGGGAPSQILTYLPCGSRTSSQLCGGHEA